MSEVPVSDKLKSSVDAAREKLHQVSDTVRQQAGRASEVARERYDAAAQTLRQGYDRASKDLTKLGNDVNVYVQRQPGTVGAGRRRVGVLHRAAGPSRATPLMDAAGRERSIANRFLDDLLPEELEWERLVRSYPIAALVVAGVAGYLLGMRSGGPDPGGGRRDRDAARHRPRRRRLRSRRLAGR